MPDVDIELAHGPGVQSQPLEVVERKGLGHPDSICDSIAEQFSLELSRTYLERFDRILHHNVDKALLFGGDSAPRLGGGEILAPMTLYLCGRATGRVGDLRIDIDEIARRATYSWLSANLRALDAQRHLRLNCLVRPGSTDLNALFARGVDTACANDTSIGVGYAPLSPLERVVLNVERALNDPLQRRQHPALGEDVKVMGVRRGEAIHLTVACAMVDRHLADQTAYEAARHNVQHIARRAASMVDQSVKVTVNAADGPTPSELYLTVTGLSAEAGDDGQAGRGNRVNGLIAPARCMTMESVAGKNPVSHVGKLYNLAAGLIAAELAARLPGLDEARCTLVSCIGRPVDRPQAVSLQLRGPAELTRAAGRSLVEEVVHNHLAAVPELWRQLLDGPLGLDRWPLDQTAMDADVRHRCWERVLERERFIEETSRLVARHATTTGIESLSPGLLRALRLVPRHAFLLAAHSTRAYAQQALAEATDDIALPPAIAALVIESLYGNPLLRRSALRVQLIGAQSQLCALFEELGWQVFDLQPSAGQASRHAELLQRLGYGDCIVRAAAPEQGWPECAPFDAILRVSMGDVPAASLHQQLVPHGRLVEVHARDDGSHQVVLSQRGLDGGVSTRLLLDAPVLP